jgi:putative hemolysin
MVNNLPLTDFLSSQAGPCLTTNNHLNEGSEPTLGFCNPGRSSCLIGGRSLQAIHQTTKHQTSPCVWPESPSCLPPEAEHWLFSQQTHTGLDFGVRHAWVHAWFSALCRSCDPGLTLLALPLYLKTGDIISSKNYTGIK